MAGMMGSGYGGMMGDAYGYYSFGWILQILILALFFLIIWWVVRNSKSFGSESASDILKKRLAKGEIGEKEYQKLKKEIEN